MKYSLYIFTFLILWITGCGEISSPADRVNISINVSPSTAGNVLSSGGDEVGATAEFLAVANEGWQFSGWTGDVESNENPLSVELEDDIALVANFEVKSNNYRFDFELFDGESYVDLAFGQKPGATDFFDSGIDLEAPPAPPSALYAWFEGDDRKLFSDFRNSLSSEIVWDLIVESGPSETIQLSWNRDDGQFVGSMVLTDRDGSFKIDMLEVSQATLDVSGTRNLQIHFDNSN